MAKSKAAMKAAAIRKDLKQEGIKGVRVRSIQGAPGWVYINIEDLAIREEDVKKAIRKYDPGNIILGYDRGALEVAASGYSEMAQELDIRVEKGIGTPIAEDETKRAVFFREAGPLDYRKMVIFQIAPDGKANSNKIDEYYIGYSIEGLARTLALMSHQYGLEVDLESI